MEVGYSVLNGVVLRTRSSCIRNLGSHVVRFLPCIAFGRVRLRCENLVIHRPDFYEFLEIADLTLIIKQVVVGIIIIMT